MPCSCLLACFQKRGKKTIKINPLPNESICEILFQTPFLYRQLSRPVVTVAHPPTCHKNRPAGRICALPLGVCAPVTPLRDFACQNQNLPRLFLLPVTCRGILSLRPDTQNFLFLCVSLKKKSEKVLSKRRPLLSARIVTLLNKLFNFV